MRDSYQKRSDERELLELFQIIKCKNISFDEQSLDKLSQIIVNFLGLQTYSDFKGEDFNKLKWLVKIIEKKFLELGINFKLTLLNMNKQNQADKQDYSSQDIILYFFNHKIIFNWYGLFTFSKYNIIYFLRFFLNQNYNDMYNSSIVSGCESEGSIQDMQNMTPQKHKNSNQKGNSDNIMESKTQVDEGQGKQELKHITPKNPINEKSQQSIQQTADNLNKSEANTQQNNYNQRKYLNNNNKSETQSLEYWQSQVSQQHQDSKQENDNLKQSSKTLNNLKQQNSQIDDQICQQCNKIEREVFIGQDIICYSCFYRKASQYL